MQYLPSPTGPLDRLAAEAGRTPRPNARDLLHTVFNLTGGEVACGSRSSAPALSAPTGERRCTEAGRRCTSSPGGRTWKPCEAAGCGCSARAATSPRTPTSPMTRRRSGRSTTSSSALRRTPTRAAVPSSSRCSARTPPWWRARTASRGGTSTSCQARTRAAASRQSTRAAQPAWCCPPSAPSGAWSTRPP